MSEPRIFLGVPGPDLIYGAMRGLMMCSEKHLVNRQASPSPHSGNLDTLWCDAFNQFEAGECTHFAMQHADVTPTPLWLDILVEEMEKYDLGMISVPVAIKDHRGLFSCGIGDPGWNWNPLRRVTVKEITSGRLPSTFTAADYGYPGFTLLHNNACWLVDFRKPEWATMVDTPEGPEWKFCHKFPRRNVRDPESGKMVPQGESEDWYFSRMVHEAGIKSAITTRVFITHRGTTEFPNNAVWNMDNQEHDEVLRSRWERHGPGLNGQAKEGVTCGS